VAEAFRSGTQLAFHLPEEARAMLDRSVRSRSTVKSTETHHCRPTLLSINHTHTQSHTDMLRQFHNTTVN